MIVAVAVAVGVGVGSGVPSTIAERYCAELSVVEAPVMSWIADPRLLL